MRKRFVGVLLVAVVGALAPGASVLAVSAAAANPASGSPGQGLEISPPVMELQANPGQTLTVEIRVRDVTNGELIAKGRVDDFGASSDETGQPKILLDETGATRYSLKYWVTNVPDLDLAPQELKSAVISIHVPANAEPGGHYGVVRFTAVPPNLQGTGVALSASVGALILLKVAGPVTDNLSLTQFTTGVAKTDQTWVDKSFFESGPVAFLVRLHNGGTVHEQPQGAIAVTDMIGRNIATVKVDENGGNVLPDSIRRFEQTLNSKKLFGLYHAKLSLMYANNQPVTGTLSFWVIPWRLVLVVIAVLVVLFFAGKWGLRKYNEHIIAIAQGKRK